MSRRRCARARPLRGGWFGYVHIVELGSAIWTPARIDEIWAPDDHPCVGVLPERAAIHRRARGGLEGTRSPVGAARAVAARQHQGPDTAERTRWMGDGEAAAGRHLRERPRDDRRQVVILFLTARVDAVRARA